jgi:hypothetical protein
MTWTDGLVAEYCSEVSYSGDGDVCAVHGVCGDWYEHGVLGWADSEGYQARKCDGGECALAAGAGCVCCGASGGEVVREERDWILRARWDDLQHMSRLL